MRIRWFLILVIGIYALHSSLRLLYVFNYDKSAGFKMSSLADLLSGVESPGSLFLRVNEFSVSASARAPTLNFDLFEGISVTDGSFGLSLGLRLSAPFEAELDSSGSLSLGFANTVASRFDLETQRSINGKLPLIASIGGNQQRFTIIFEEGTAKVDFDVCSIQNVVLPILGKLGAFSMSPSSILGPQSLDFFASTIDSLDDIFPDIGKLLSGVLEGKSCTNSLSALLIEWLFLIIIIGQQKMSYFICALKLRILEKSHQHCKMSLPSSKKMSLHWLAHAHSSQVSK